MKPVEAAKEEKKVWTGAMQPKVARGHLPGPRNMAKCLHLDPQCRGIKQEKDSVEDVEDLPALS